MKKGHLFLIIIILLFISIVCIFSYLKKAKIEEPIIETHTGGKLQEVTDRNNYYMVKNCVNKFYKYYARMFDSKEDSDIEKTYFLLDKKYIYFKDITTENMCTLLPRKGYVVVNITDMWCSIQSENISVYIVQGILREEITKELSNFKIMVQIDSSNGTFSILLQDYLEEKYNNINLGDNLKVETLSNIEQNKCNLFVLEEISDQKYAIDLFNNYKEEVLYNTTLAYGHLNEEYRNIKFETLKNFQDYAEKNRTQNTEMKIQKYQKAAEEFYTQYTCVDQKGYYYIFRETGIMKYNLLLDTYTIDLPEFLENYNSSNTIKKVGYNIQKCLDAINYKDYSYVYNKLDFEFKAINYPTLESLEKEIKNKLFDYNEVKEVTSFFEGETHIYKLTITDLKTNKKEQKMTIIMQLKEGTNFVMSFSFEE